MSETVLPSAQEVRELVEGLLGRDVQVLTGGRIIDPAEPGGAMVGAYVDRLLRLRALVVLDLAFAARCGAAIGLVPNRISEGDVAAQELSDTLAENAAEVLNVTASLFNTGDGPHLRLDGVAEPGQPLPHDLARWVNAYVPRLDLTVDIAGYGEGAVSILLIP